MSVLSSDPDTRKRDVLGPEGVLLAWDAINGWVMSGDSSGLILGWRSDINSSLI